MIHRPARKYDINSRVCTWGMVRVKQLLGVEELAVEGWRMHIKARVDV